MSWAPFALVAAQICAWTALGALFEGSIDADVAEGVVDGPEWRLSYLRHPPLSSWLSGVASTTGPWRYFVLFGIALAFGCGAFALVSLFIRRVDGRTAGVDVVPAPSRHGSIIFQISQDLRQKKKYSF